MTSSNGLKMEISKEYIAGFFEGEGSVNCTRYKGHLYRRRFVNIANKNKDVLLLIKKKYGGSIRLKSNRVPCWQFELTKKSEIKQFLEDMLPYLIIKREGALKCLKTI
jgi:hypothetical protein